MSRSSMTSHHALSISSKAKGVTPQKWHSLLFFLHPKRFKRWHEEIIGEQKRPDAGQGTVIEQVRGTFENGMSLDARLVGTDVTPFLDLVLFSEDGDEVGSFDPSHTLEQTPHMEIGGEIYQVGFAKQHTRPDRMKPLENVYADGHTYRCQSCRHESFRSFFQKAKDIQARMAPGSTFSDVECPRCGALAFPAEELLEEVGKAA